MAKVVNYYEIKKRISSIINRIENSDLKDYSDIFYDGLSLIFDYDILRNYFVNTVKEVHKSTETKEFKKYYDKTYKAYQNDITEIANKDKTLINFPESPIEPQPICKVLDIHYSYVQKLSYIDKLNANKKYKCEIDLQDWYKYYECLEYEDYPNIFIYESCMALLKSDFDDYDYDGNIKCCKNLYYFYLTNFNIKITNILKNIEYYICASETGLQLDDGIFYQALCLSSLWHVMINLKTLIDKNLENEYGFEVMQQQICQWSCAHEVKFNTRVGKYHLYIDNKPIKGISKKDLEFIFAIINKNYHQLDNFKDDLYLSKRKSGINKAVAESINPSKQISKDEQFIARDNITKMYCINTNAYRLPATIK